MRNHTKLHLISYFPLKNHEEEVIAEIHKKQMSDTVKAFLRFLKMKMKKKCLLFIMVVE